MMSPRGKRLLPLLLAGIGLSAGGCDRGAGDSQNNAKSAAAPSAAPATQPGSGDLSAIQKMVAASGKAPGSGTALPALPPGHPPVPGVNIPPPTASPNLPAGHPPVNAATSMPSARDTPEPGVLLKWEDPLDWKPTRPASMFRLAQYEIPGAEGQGPGELAVFHFTGSGGTVADNVARWVGQFTDADGKPIDPATLKHETFEANGLDVHFVEVSGYMMVSRTMGGTGERSPSQYRLLGGIVEMRDGNWFFKGTGPDKTMAAAREAFLAMLRSVHEGEATDTNP